MSWSLAEMAREPFVLCDGASTRIPLSASTAAPAVCPVTVRDTLASTRKTRVTRPAPPRAASLPPPAVPAQPAPTEGLALLADTVRKVGPADRKTIAHRSGVRLSIVEKLLPLAVRDGWLEVDKHRLPYLYRLPAVPHP